MSNIDFSELHHELAREFYFYADQRGRSYLDSIMEMYWISRGPVLASCASDLNGSKYLVTTDDASQLPDLVRKGLMAAEHVIIRHDGFLPVGSGIRAISCPDDFVGFGKLDWLERHSELLHTRGHKGVPCFRSHPPANEFAPFVEWLCGDGRQWFEKGNVTYAPVLPPGQVEAGLLNEGVNIAAAFTEKQIIPQNDKLINPKTAAALARLKIPHLKGVNADLLAELKLSEPEAFNAFRNHLQLLLSGISQDISTPAFNQQIEKLSVELEDKVR